MDQPEPAPEKKIDGKATQKRGAAMLERIRAAEKREKTWRGHAEAAEKAFAADEDMKQGKLLDFNIVHSNVETIVPAIYNSTPVPDIRPRRTEKVGPEPQPPQMAPPAPDQPMDPMQAQQMQAEMMAFQQAAQEYQLKKQRDDDSKLYAQIMERAIAVQIDDNKLDTEVEGETQDSFIAGRGIIRLRFNADVTDTGVSNENVTFEAVSWRDYREGPAKRWQDVPWVAYRQVIARETYDRFQDKDLTSVQETAMKNGGEPILFNDEKDDDVSLWEYWDKLEKKVCFIREADGVIVKEEDDPLGLKEFFPQPPPVQPICKTGQRTPVCPYKIYEKLAAELDRVTKRINKITEGMKVRGIAAGQAQSLSRLSEADDNEIIIEANLEQLIQTGGLDKAIAWWPIEQAAKVLAQLYTQREQVKQAIYEITGISDIVRGASDAQETLGAQQIKTKWGSLRIQKMQRLIERQVRDIFVIMAQIISTKFSPETLTKMTGLDMTEGVVALMRDPIDAHYRVNVESNSTVRADLTNEKAEMAEFLGATGQYFASAGQIIMQQPQAAEPLAEIYGANAKMFKLGKQVDDAIERFVDMAKQTAANPPPNPEMQKMEMEKETRGQEMAAKQAETESKAALEKQRFEHEQARDASQAQLEQRRFMMDRVKLRQEMKGADREHGLKMSQQGAVEGEDGSIEIKGQKAILEGQQAIMQGLNMLAQTLAQITQAVLAPRKAEIQIGPNGKKTAVSVPVLQ